MIFSLSFIIWNRQESLIYLDSLCLLLKWISQFKGLANTDVLIINHFKKKKRFAGLSDYVDNYEEKFCMVQI